MSSQLARPVRATRMCVDIVRMGIVEDRRCGILAGKGDGGSAEPRCKLQSFGYDLAFCFVATQFA